MGGNLKFQAQDSFLNNFFERLGDLKNESHYLKKKTPLKDAKNHILSIKEVHSFFVMKPHSSKHLVLLGVCFASGVFIPVALGRFYKGFVKAKLK